MVFSANGTQLAEYSAEFGLALYDFNRTTGELSNLRRYEWSPNTGPGGIRVGGCMFSASGRFLYVSTHDELYQFDLHEPTLAEGVTFIAARDDHEDPFPLHFFNMERGPDCKIYMTTTTGAFTWHVILNPEEKGLACNFRQHHLDFPFPHDRGLPNWPNYRLGTDQPTCDPTNDVITSLHSPERIPVLALDVQPSPTTGPLRVEFPHQTKARILLFDAWGRNHRETYLEAGSFVNWEVADLPPGVYYISLRSQDGTYGTGRVTVQ